jgi:CBS domain containing-hemolysin-like protein
VSRAGWELVAAALATGFAFFASVWVNAVSRLSHARARHLQELSPKRGAILVALANNPRSYLAATLLTMLLARVIATVLVADVVFRSGVPMAGVLTVAVMTFVLFQFAEIAPRTWVLERPDQVMLLAARPVWALGTALHPLVSLLIAVNRIFLLILPGHGVPRGPVASEEEIMSMLEVAESEDVIETQERQMISSIFEFGDTVVREVMVPRPDMICVDADDDLNAVLDVMLTKGFTRVPVIRGSIDELIGIVHARDVMAAVRADGTRQSRHASDVMRDVMFVPEFKKTAELLRELQAGKTQMAVVVDEYGGIAGLVTMEDLLEEIVGEIVDEHDHDEPPLERLDDGSLRVIARFGVDELSELLDVELPNADWDSVGGLVVGTLGRVPSEGDRVTVHGVELEVERMNGRRIGKVLVHAQPGPAESTAPAVGP